MNNSLTDWTRDDLIDLIESAINDSMDMDWTAKTGALSVIAALEAESLAVAPDLGKLVKKHGLASASNGALAADLREAGFFNSLSIQWIDAKGIRYCASTNEGSIHQGMAEVLAKHELQILADEDLIHDTLIGALDAAGEAA